MGRKQVREDRSRALHIYSNVSRACFRGRFGRSGLARRNRRAVWDVARAIDAGPGVRGLIPGSMGTASYVVTGKGNPLALSSSPHGAGRNHSRTAARRMFKREDLNRRMGSIAWGESDAFLDEHPDAYKDIDVVMRDSRDLVTVDHTLRQIVNVKGD